jgi:subtilisin-like proprotein convertase family protein
VTGGRLNLFTLLNQGQGGTGGAYVTSAVPSGTTSISSVRLTFSEAVQPGTFSAIDDVIFTGPNGSPVAVASIQPVGTSNTQFDLILVSPQTAVGTYQFKVGPNVLNGAGQPMDQDRDGTPGEATEDQYGTTFTVSNAATYNSGTVNLPIRFFFRAVSTINVGANERVADVNVRVNLTHTWDADLVLTLVAPDGTQIRLVNRRGGSGDNFTNTVFDDEAATPITSGSAPFTGSFRPETALSGLDGKLATGNWQLWADDLALLNAGVLNNWSLTFEWAGGQTAFAAGDGATGSSAPVFGNGLGGGTGVTFNLSDERRTDRQASEPSSQADEAPVIATVAGGTAAPATSAAEAQGRQIELTFRFPVWLGDL